MMKLLSNPLSPYGRKVKITIGMKGLKDIEIVHVDTNVPDNAAINQANPLAKIPALVVDGNAAIYDSHVICEYLDSLAPSPVLFPKSGVERIKTLTLGSRTTASSMPRCCWSTRSGSGRRRSGTHPGRRASRARSSAPSIIWRRRRRLGDRQPDYGHLTLACALGYLDFRHDGKWRAEHPSWWRGSTNSPPPCQRSRRRGRSNNAPIAPRSNHPSPRTRAAPRLSWNQAPTGGAFASDSRDSLRARDSTAQATRTD